MTLIILLHILFASTFTTGKFLSSQTSPVFLTGLRMLLGGLIVLFYFGINKKIRKQMFFDKRDWSLFLKVTLCGVYFNYILRFWALAYLPSSKTCFLFNFQPFLSSFYLYLLYGQRLSKEKWIGLITGFIGMLPILIGTTNAEPVLPDYFFVSLPELAVLISVAMHSYSWIVVQELVKDKAYNPAFVTGTTMTAGGVLALLTAWCIGDLPALSHSKEFIFWLMFVVLVSNVFCHNLYGHLLKKYSATLMAFASFLTPIFAAFLGWAFLHETISWHFYVSTVIVLTGLYIFYKDELKGAPPI